MSPTVVLVWLSTDAARAAHEPDLASWAEARLVKLDGPSGEAQGPLASHDDALADRLEALLAEARTAVYSLDLDGATKALDLAEAEIGRHPELPEAAWLRAEVLRARADALEASDPVLSHELAGRATLLDGGQTTDFARVARHKAGLAVKRPAAPEGKAGAARSLEEGVALVGPLDGDEVVVDGSTRLPPWNLVKGLHHVRVVRRGRVAYAAWVTAGSTPVELPIPGPVACSESDLRDATALASGRQSSTLVACELWAMARPAGETRVEIALCRHSACGAFLPWSRSWGETFAGPPQPAWPPPASHAWVHWLIGGALAAGATSFVLYKAGAFDQEGPPRTTYTATWGSRPK